MGIVEYLQNKANILRLHSVRATSKAGSGHPTSCLSAAEIVAMLFFKEMNLDAQTSIAPKMMNLCYQRDMRLLFLTPP